ncbi:hypothetical protein HK100_005399 [Physocladia obscura]|uniref:Cyclic nucleotide-binding domain-containing protein n=1 Tax=Physocladia obscura TaxID=109957 RepID=A0AAD5XCB8_9FUNG|nr:hypothetical protein HK100_005399 [Physocladia obscura]
MSSCDDLGLLIADLRSKFELLEHQVSLIHPIASRLFAAFESRRDSTITRNQIIPNRGVIKVESDNNDQFFRNIIPSREFSANESTTSADNWSIEAISAEDVEVWKDSQKSLKPILLTTGNSTTVEQPISQFAQTTTPSQIAPREHGSTTRNGLIIPRSPYLKPESEFASNGNELNKHLNVKEKSSIPPIIVINRKKSTRINSSQQPQLPPPPEPQLPFWFLKKNSNIIPVETSMKRVVSTRGRRRSSSRVSISGDRENMPAETATITNSSNYNNKDSNKDSNTNTSTPLVRTKSALRSSNTTAITVPQEKRRVSISTSIKSDKRIPRPGKHFFTQKLKAITGDMKYNSKGSFVSALNLSTSQSFHKDESKGIWQFLSQGINVLSALTDCILEFFTVRTTHPAMQALKSCTLADWRTHYISHGFIIDFLTSIPLEVLPFPNSYYLLVLRMARIYKLPDIIAASPKYSRLQKSLQSVLGIGSSVSMIFPLSCVFFLFLHLQACSLFLAARLHGFSNVETAPLINQTIYERYTWAIFSAVGNSFPMTYKPTEPTEQWIVLGFIIIGAFLYASIVGTISSLAMGLDASGRMYKQKIDELKEYMRWREIIPETRKKMMKYYELKYRGKYFEEDTLLSDMNDSLRMEIAAQNCKELISKVSFLCREQNDGRDELFMGRIAIALTSCFFVSGDVIFIQGEMGNEMYFVMNGVVEVMVGKTRVTTLKEGSFFGEVALIANIPRTATVRAVSSCRLYRLTRNAFLSILDEFEDVRKKVDVIYKERMERIGLEEKERKLGDARELVTKVPFLNRVEKDGRDEEFLDRVANVLVPMFCMPDEIIYAAGEIGADMFFVKTGNVEASAPGEKLLLYGEGSFFGEVALIANIPRKYTMKAAVPCALYRLTRTAFIEIMSDFDDRRERIDDVYRERMEKMQRQIDEFEDHMRIERNDLNVEFISEESDK